MLARRDEIVHDLDDSVQLPWLEDRGVYARARLGGSWPASGAWSVGGEELEARKRGVIVAGGSTPSPAADRRAGRTTGRVDEPRGDDGEEDPRTAGDHRRRRRRRGSMAQAFQTLGSRVTLVEGERRLLPREEEFACAQVTATSPNWEWALSPGIRKAPAMSMPQKYCRKPRAATPAASQVSQATSRSMSCQERRPSPARRTTPSQQAKAMSPRFAADTDKEVIAWMVGTSRLVDVVELLVQTGRHVPARRHPVHVARQHRCSEQTGRDAQRGDALDRVQPTERGAAPPDQARDAPQVRRRAGRADLAHHQLGGDAEQEHAVDREERARGQPGGTRSSARRRSLGKEVGLRHVSDPGAASCA